MDYQLMNGSWGTREDRDREELEEIKRDPVFQHNLAMGYALEDGSYVSFDKYAEINYRRVREALVKRDRFATIHFTWGVHGYRFDGRDIHVDKQMREILYQWMIDTLPDWTYTLESDRWVPRFLLPEEAAVLQKIADDRGVMWSPNILENHAEGLARSS